jgi:chemotaxis protein methyltransferase CheR
VPEKRRETAFRGHSLRSKIRGRVRFLHQDIRAEMPAGPFDLVLCRNLVFTYFDAELQRELLSRIRARLAPNGLLGIGAHESLSSVAFERVGPSLLRLR